MSGAAGQASRRFLDAFRRSNQSYPALLNSVLTGHVVRVQRSGFVEVDVGLHRCGPAVARALVCRRVGLRVLARVRARARSVRGGSALADARLSHTPSCFRVAARRVGGGRPARTLTAPPARPHPRHQPAPS